MEKGPPSSSGERSNKNRKLGRASIFALGASMGLGASELANRAADGIGIAPASDISIIERQYLAEKPNLKTDVGAELALANFGISKLQMRSTELVAHYEGRTRVVTPFPDVVRATYITMPAQAPQGVLRVTSLYRDGGGVTFLMDIKTWIAETENPQNSISDVTTLPR